MDQPEIEISELLNYCCTVISQFYTQNVGDFRFADLYIVYPSVHTVGPLRVQLEGKDSLEMRLQTGAFSLFVLSVSLPQKLRERE